MPAPYRLCIKNVPDLLLRKKKVELMLRKEKNISEEIKVLEEKELKS